MGLLDIGIGAIVETVGNIADDLFTSDEERGRLELENRKLDQAIDLKQIEVNKSEAASRSIFVAGWRPFIGWVCGAAFAYHFVVLPILLFIMSATATTLTDLPEFDLSSMMPVLLGMLGLGGLRTFEKTKKVSK